MENSLSQITVESHHQTKVKKNTHYHSYKKHHILPIVVHEYASVATEFPIVFVKNVDSGKFDSVAMFGFEVNENVFYQKGQWQGHYTPLNMRKAPFSVTATSKELDQFALCLDESSELVSTTEGEALFTDSGEQSDFLKAKQKEITALIEKTFITDALIKLLIEKDLLIPRGFTITREDGSKHDVDGIYIVSEKKLQELSTDDYLSLKAKGFLLPIYAHLISLNQIGRLAEKRN
jgi:hypothetical protein